MLQHTQGGLPVSGDGLANPAPSPNEATITVHVHTMPLDTHRVTGCVDLEDIKTSQGTNNAPRTETDADTVDQYFIWHVGQVINKGIKFYLDNYVCLILTATLGVALNVACIKILSANISVFQIMAIRSGFCSVVLLIMCWWTGVSLIEPPKKVPLFLLRGIFGAFAFLGLAFMVTAVMSWLLGMEHLGALSWSGVCGCFIGNSLVAQPPFLYDGMADWGFDRIIGLVAACVSNLFMGATFILIRHIGKSVHTIVLTAYMHLFCFIFTFPFLFFSFPLPVSLRHSSMELLCYGGTCVLGVCLQLASTRALQIGPPSKVTSLYMTNMLLSGVFGVVFLSEKISFLSIAGAAIILISVLLVTAQKPKKAEPSTHTASSEQVHEREREREEQPEIQS